MTIGGLRPFVALWMGSALTLVAMGEFEACARFAEQSQAMAGADLSKSPSALVAQAQIAN